MSVRIRLTRTGKKHQPSYRIVVADSQVKRNGKVIEVLGFYNPLTDPATVRINRPRFDYWLSVGAQPSDPVRALILGQKRMRMKSKKKGITEALKRKETLKKETATTETQTKKETQKEKE
ncbi:hypothetical protein ES702_06102 [subsurface metagenome]